MRTVTVTFEEVRRRRTVSGVCPACQKRVTRTITVTHTVNPFNRRADGRPRTRAEVVEAVGSELSRRAALPVYHARCKA
jgi:hypothetical protein